MNVQHGTSHKKPPVHKGAFCGRPRKTVGTLPSFKKENASIELNCLECQK